MGGWDAWWDAQRINGVMEWIVGQIEGGCCGQWVDGAHDGCMGWMVGCEQIVGWIECG